MSDHKKNVIWHVSMFGALEVFSVAYRPWWFAIVVLAAAILFFPIEEPT